MISRSITVAGGYREGRLIWQSAHRTFESNKVDARVNHHGPSESESERDDRIDERKEKKRGSREPSMTSHCCLIKPVNALPVIPPS